MTDEVDKPSPDQLDLEYKFMDIDDIFQYAMPMDTRAEGDVFFGAVREGSLKKEKLSSSESGNLDVFDVKLQTPIDGDRWLSSSQECALLQELQVDDTPVPLPITVVSLIPTATVSRDAAVGQGQAEENFNASGVFGFANTNSEAEDMITDNDLKRLSTPELNRLVTLRRLSKEDVKNVKKRRRTLKNRGYARKCRASRIDKQTGSEDLCRRLQQENVQLRRQLATRRDMEDRATQTDNV